MRQKERQQKRNRKEEDNTGKSKDEERRMEALEHKEEAEKPLSSFFLSLFFYSYSIFYSFLQSPFSQ